MRNERECETLRDTHKFIITIDVEEACFFNHELLEWHEWLKLQRKELESFTAKL